MTINDILQKQRAYKKRLLEANRDAARYYCRCFLDPKIGEPARAYAARRARSR